MSLWASSLLLHTSPCNLCNFSSAASAAESHAKEFQDQLRCAAGQCTGSHLIQQGDTLQNLAAQYLGTPDFSQLMIANPWVKDPAAIIAGDHLNIPPCSTQIGASLLHALLTACELTLSWPLTCSCENAFTCAQPKFVTAQICSDKWTSACPWQSESAMGNSLQRQDVSHSVMHQQ